MLRTLVLWTFLIALFAPVASADVIGVYSDASGASCGFAAGFTATATVMHKFTYGSVGSNFKLVLPAGSTFLAFSSLFLSIPVTEGNMSLQYGQCLNGSFSLGTIVAVLNHGIIHIAPLDNGIGYVQSITCSGTSRFVYPGQAWVGVGFNPCQPLPVEATSWGAVKALYR